MLDYYRQHPQYAVLIIVLLIITLFVCYKAVKSSLDRAARNQKIINKLKEQNRLANDFAILTRELIESAAPADLFGGVGINLQRNIAAKTDMAGFEPAYSRDLNAGEGPTSYSTYILRNPSFFLYTTKKL